MQSMIQQFQSARKVSTPLLSIRTPDPGATIKAIYDSLNGRAEVEPMVQWDAVRGLSELNKAGATALANCIGADGLEGAIDPVNALISAARLLPRTIMFMHNAQRVIDNLAVIQALWNLRDDYKGDFRCIVLLGPDLQLPPELTNDVLVLDEPLPGADELAAIVTSAYESAELEAPTPTVLNKAVDAVLGLAAFPADQNVAMSLTPDGVDMDSLYTRKCKILEQQDGITIWRGGETFADVAGNDNAKQFISRMIQKSKTPIRCILWLDEIEKAFAGLGQSGGPGDNTGVTQDQLQQILKWWEDKKIRAILLTGFAGTGKSLVAKASGGEAGVPVIEADLGGMKDSRLGESERKLRSFIKVVEAMSNGGVLAIATCNNVQNLPPELLSRFRRGQFFFDLPDAQERQAMWALHLSKNGLDINSADVPSLVNDTDWTGREIESCCSIAADLDIDLTAAAAYVVPVAKTMGEDVDRLRRYADGRFLSASHDGSYCRNRGVVETTEPAPTHNRKRAMNLNG